MLAGDGALELTLIGSSNSTCMAASKICTEIENMEATGTVSEMRP